MFRYVKCAYIHSFKCTIMLDPMYVYVYIIIYLTYIVLPRYILVYLHITIIPHERQNYDSI